jgi:hypothetical protein
MGRIHVGLATWNLLFLVAATVLGFLRRGAVEPRVHLLTGLFAAIFCCLVHAIVFAHFIGSGKWIKAGAFTAQLPDADAIVKRTKRFKGKTFPFALFSMLFVIATAVLGGGADPRSAGASGGTVPSGVHLGFALATLALNVVALFMERSAILENGRIIARVSEANRARVEAGIQPELRPAAALESVRAGSKVFLFLAANVWFLYAYRVFVVRRPDEPWIPYAVACLVLGWTGFRMRAGERDAG